MLIAIGGIVLMIAVGLSAGDIESVGAVLCFTCLFILVYEIIMLIFLCRPSVGSNKWGVPARPDIRY